MKKLIIILLSLLMIMTLGCAKKERLILLSNNTITLKSSDEFPSDVRTFLDVSKLSEDEIASIKISIVKPLLDEDGRIDLEKATPFDKTIYGEYALVFSLDGEQKHIYLNYVDDEAPKITTVKDLELTLGQRVDFNEYFTCENESSVTFKFDDSDVNYYALGTYSLKVEAIDEANNRTKETFKLKIKKGEANENKGDEVTLSNHPYSEEEDSILSELNTYRTQSGLNELSRNASLDEKALKAAEGLANGGSFSIAVSQSTYAYGSGAGISWVSIWKSTSSTNDLLLSGSSTQIGIGIAKGKDYYYAVIAFN